jgi:endogenous inhibitor of DNA gyrase (YacG/DUF329 family)
MTEKQKVTALCNSCKKPLSVNHQGPCPFCGKNGKNISVVIHETFRISDTLNWEKRKEFWENNLMMKCLIWSITFISSILGWLISGLIGIIIGLILGSIVNLIGPYAATKVIEIESGKS